VAPQLMTAPDPVCPGPIPGPIALEPLPVASMTRPFFAPGRHAAEHHQDSDHESPHAA